MCICQNVVSVIFPSAFPKLSFPASMQGPKTAHVIVCTRQPAGDMPGNGISKQIHTRQVSISDSLCKMDSKTMMICTACGSQYDQPPQNKCKICDVSTEACPVESVSVVE